MHRTPARKTMDTSLRVVSQADDRAGPSISPTQTSKVRRSIGESEVGKLAGKSVSPVKSPSKIVPVAPAKSRPKHVVLTETRPLARRTFTDVQAQSPTAQKPR